MFYSVALISYVIDNIFGEFNIKHPVEYMGDYITFYKNHFYRDNVLSGFILTLSLSVISITIATMIVNLVNAIFPEDSLKGLNIITISIISSTGIAGNMLYNSVRNVLISDNPKYEISMLVSRDTENMTSSDIYKACIETYSENLSDGVVAPLFYLILFGLPGIAFYKAVNTLDSMVGYKTDKYINFGMVSAKLDDILNFIPARITGLLIFIVSGNVNALKSMMKYGNKHESPNAGYPISAMAGALGISLGGDTSYHGKIKNKPYFGSGRKEITEDDVYKTLDYRKNIDLVIIGGLSILCMLNLSV